MRRRANACRLLVQFDPHVPDMTSPNAHIKIVRRMCHVFINSNYASEMTNDVMLVGRKSSWRHLKGDATSGCNGSSALTICCTMGIAYVRAYDNLLARASRLKRKSRESLPVPFFSMYGGALCLFAIRNTLVY